MGSSVFGFQENISIVCYTRKARKSVTSISSMHYEPILAESEPFKPEIIQFYNQTKGGVDNWDKHVRTYSSIRKCNRWPVTLFFNLIDIAAYNTSVCYVFTDPNYHKGKLSRQRLFLEKLAFQLIGKDTHDAPDTSNPPSTSTSNRRKKSRCLDCPRKDDEKTSEVCNKRENPICKNHTKTFFGCCDSNWFENFLANKHFWIKNYFYIKFRSNFIFQQLLGPRNS